LAEGEILHGFSKELKIKVFSRLLFVSKEVATTLSEHSNYSPLAYSERSMLSCKAKYSD